MVSCYIRLFYVGSDSVFIPLAYRNATFSTLCTVTRAPVADLLSSRALPVTLPTLKALMAEVRQNCILPTVPVLPTEDSATRRSC